MTLSGKQIKLTVNEMLATGLSRAEVYDQLLYQVDNEKRLAQYVAGYVDPALYAKHKNKLNWLMVAIGMQVLLGFFAAIAILGLSSASVFAAFIGSGILGLIGYMIYRMNPWGFLLLFILSINQISKLIGTLKEEPISTTIALAITIGTLSYAVHVQSKIVPHMPFFSQVIRGKNAKYAFLEEAQS